MTQEELQLLINQAADEGWTELDLAGKGLSSLPPEIGKLTQLETLILGKVEKWKWVEDKLIPTLVTNQLTTLPSELTALKNLKTLNLSGNLLTSIPNCVLQLQLLESLTLVSIGLSAIPAVIGSLTNLTTLYLSSNQISEIPAVIGNLTNLTELYLYSNQISEIPAVIGNLTNLTTLYLSSNQISEIPAVISNLTNLTELYLYSNQISEIPAVLGSLTNLTTLDLSSNQISEIPAVIGSLTNLTTLYLYSNQISEIPAVIGNLTNLTTLALSSNQISEIPAVIGSLTNLTELNLHSNQISEIPAVLGSLTNLTTLYLSSNQISEIPAVIGNLTNLTTLYLSSNQISEIPAVIGNLTNLTELYLYSNQISEIPAVIGNLTNLTTLYLSSNQISEIPAVIGSLTNLTTLDLSSNQISEIPAVIGNLTNLTELYLYSNQISEIPAVIGNLTNLTTLYLSSNQISEIPAVIGNLTNLTTLALSSNQISEIPAVIGNLTNLTTLYLHSNQISEIPAVIGNLTNLTTLYLYSNQISEIPESLGSLTNLTTLYLHSNQISEIPAVLGSLTNLTTLALSSNQISEIPAVIGSLTNLTTLDLSSNQISEIPAVIGNLTNLTTLDLEQNQITQLPAVLLQLSNLEKLDLRGNPIPIPPDILALREGEKLPEARPILGYYFRTQDPQQTTHLYEAKLLIVGEGGSGKTSFAHKLLDPAYELPPETADTSTEGIDILRWEFTGRNQHLYRVNIWDFGGQEIYHQTHQFFLTDRSLYVLVADSRKEDTDHYFWLQIIRLLSNDSPVLLIQNEKQNRTCNLNLRELRAEFENLKPSVKVNLADNRGLPEAQTTIQNNLEDLLPHGIPFPNSWLNVRYALENDGRNYIDCSDYEAICRYHGITRRQEMFNLSSFLHSLGICLHFQQDPILRRRLILKPNWGTAAVYKILDNPTVKQNLGQFSNDDLRQMWQASQYDDMHDELLQLMKEFKVCYEIPQRNGNYIAPHLLLPDQPEYEWDTTQNLTLRYRYKGFMPKGILTRFIVEMHKCIENVSTPDTALVWKNGVVLNRDRARAEVIERYHDREIRVRLSGTHQRDFLVIINNEFQKIHDSYERLNYDTLIPCNCALCKANTKPYSYPLERLRQFIDQRRPTIQCYESSEDVNVRRLLDDTIEPVQDPLLPGIRDRSIPEMDQLGLPKLQGRLNLIYIDQQGDYQPMTENTNNLQGANIGNFANEVKDSARQQANQHIHQTTNQNLAQAAKDIKALLDQLDKDYDCTTPTGQAMISAKTIEAIEKNPTLKARVINALKEGGTTALEVAIDHPAVKPVVALLKGFVDAK